MTFGSVVTQSVSEQIAQQLRNAIQSGELKPGERLVERTLAGRLGVSHIPIREALSKLADEGLVDRTPRRGARVAALSEQELGEISSLRTVLEQFVAQRVQAGWNVESEKALKDIVISMVESAHAGNIPTMFALDRKFHETLWELADHRMLMSTVAQLRGRINGFLRAANEALTSTELATHAESHFDIIDAIASGDEARVRGEIARHIELAAERIRLQPTRPDDE